MKKLTILTALMMTLCSCTPAERTTVLTVLAAASLTDVCGELEGMYESTHTDVDLVFSFGSSGALQAQIEEGAPADVFLSASSKQMDALIEEGLMSDNVTELLENRIVLVVPSDNEPLTFADAATDKVTLIALGEPGSVPAGQYAEEVFSSMGLLDTVKAKANYGSDVRTVLSWVEAGEVDCGVVYATDAYTTNRVKITDTAPEGSCRKVVYPAGVTASCRDKEKAGVFMDFLSSDEAKTVFASYGFTV